jgi:hypothetical protein
MFHIQAKKSEDTCLNGVIAAILSATLNPEGQLTVQELQSAQT